MFFAINWCGVKHPGAADTLSAVVVVHARAPGVAPLPRSLDAPTKCENFKRLPTQNKKRQEEENEEKQSCVMV